MTTANLWGSTVIVFSLILLSITTLYNETIHQIDGVEPQQNRGSVRMSSGCYSSPEWYRILERKIKRRTTRMKIGVIGGGGIKCGGDVDLVSMNFQPVSKDVKWKDLYPEWIDENAPDPSRCPDFPMPKSKDYSGLDAVVADVSCPKAGRPNGRDHDDVLRLQVNLAVANLLARSGRRSNQGVFAVFTGSCRPMLEIFRCEDLAFQDGNTSVYRPDLNWLMQKIHMPVGSCQLAPPFPKPGFGQEKAKEAYVTVLHSSEDYVCGAIALARSIIMSNTTKDLILLADDSISIRHLRGLKAAGWKIKLIKRIRNPYTTDTESYNQWNYSKLRIWQLTEYQKLIFIDSDFIVLHNIDKFFIYPQLSAVANSRHIFNSGLMLVEPSTCMFRTLVQCTK